MYQATNPMPDASQKHLAEKYQKKTDKEHILDNPDTYIGSVEHLETDLYVFQDDNTIKSRNIQFIPGLFKLFDEAIVNARDHAVRTHQWRDEGKQGFPLTYIDVAVNEEDGSITITNDGDGIDVEKHPVYDIWIPEMIFGHLRTGTNYNKDEEKIVGGKNGFGVKLIFTWSTYGRIETIDSTRGLKYTQEFKNNLDEICKPSIRKCKGKPYTKITFIPDYKRLGIDGLTKDCVQLFKRRVFDIAAITDKTVKVKWNSSILPVKHFQQYVDYYIGSKGDVKRIHESPHARWEYVVCLSPTGEFQHVSFVNGIYTSKGGKHVEYILNQVVRKIVAYIKKKKHIDVKPNTIKEQLMLFLRCDINNPAFDSQTKDFMNTPSSKFGSSCTVSDAFVEKVAKMGVMDTACELTAVKMKKAVKKTDGAKSKTIRGIPKLVDANFAGTAKASQCTIIFCEGDSAKAGIISGLTKDDRNFIGVYPMKGKLFNVRGESVKRIGDNKEIIEIKQILGLEMGRKYKTIEDAHAALRYGKILFMTDQDLDGSHIKGLGINLFQSEWQSLFKLGIIGFMNTPILKARKGQSEHQFYSEGEYQKWKDEADRSGWKIKYYKGLGTSTGKEFKEYFKEKRVVQFEWTDESDDAIDMVFNKKRANDRKDWLAEYDRNEYLDTTDESVSYEKFIHMEMKHFSKYDCDRSIPNLMDGLKISLRKILFAAFKKKLNQEIKVAQFSGYVSEHSGYHHGEASLNGAIVGMAQDYVGSNNINLLLPLGQFGTRLNGGKDSASERYIFTRLNSITRGLFPAEDDAILDYLDDDGTPVEPVYYAPIIPMILVNGTKGIGTGFSTEIMPHNPKDLVRYLKNKLKGIANTDRLMPYYQGFQGEVREIDGIKNKFLVRGCYNIIADNKVQITELPIGTWTDDYKAFLEKLIDSKNDGVVKDFNDMSTDKLVNITVIFHKKGYATKMESTQVEYGCNALEKYLKLYTTISATNMHLFDAKEQLKKYNTTEEIIDDYYDRRLELYAERKKHQLKIMGEELVLLSNKAKYITELLEDTIDLRRKKKDAIIQMLSQKDYDMIGGDYNYLIKMPMDSVCQENVEKLLATRGQKEAEIALLKKTKIQDIWMSELGKLDL